MRPIVSEQNPLRYPLNELLSTQAHIRLLRVMTNEVDGPLTASDAAKRAGLTVPGAQKALKTFPWKRAKSMCKSPWASRPKVTLISCKPS